MLRQSCPSDNRTRPSYASPCVPGATHRNERSGNHIPRLKTGPPYNQAKPNPPPRLARNISEKGYDVKEQHGKAKCQANPRSYHEAHNTPHPARSASWPLLSAASSPATAPNSAPITMPRGGMTRNPPIIPTTAPATPNLEAP